MLLVCLFLCLPKTEIQTPASIKTEEQHPIVANISTTRAMQALRKAPYINSRPQFPPSLLFIYFGPVSVAWEAFLHAQTFTGAAGAASAALRAALAFF
jgi:hypothetical protein